MCQNEPAPLRGPCALLRRQVFFGRARAAFQGLSGVPSMFLVLAAGTTAIVAAGRGTANRHGLVVVHDVVADQVDAALLVDLGHLALEGVADVDHVLDLVHAAVGQLGDVDHAVLAGGRTRRTRRRA